MTRLERAQVQALRRWVRVPNFAYGSAVMRNLDWRLRYFPNKPLSWKEKYLLDGCLYHYRATLGGLVDFELPTAAPDLADYQPPARGGQNLLL